MSRSYNMHVTIIGFQAENVDKIKQAANEEWDFDDWNEIEEQLEGGGDSSLTGGETEDEFADRLARAIWEANGEFCSVEVTGTCLEYLPHETYSLDEDDYERLLKSRE